MDGIKALGLREPLPSSIYGGGGIVYRSKFGKNRHPRNTKIGWNYRDLKLGVIDYGHISCFFCIFYGIFVFGYSWY